MTGPKNLPATYTSDTGRPEDLRRERPTADRMKRLAALPEVTAVVCPKGHPVAVARHKPGPAGVWRAWAGPHARPVRMELDRDQPVHVSCRCGTVWPLNLDKLEQAARDGEGRVSLSRVT